MIIADDIKTEIEAYCKLNNIADITAFVTRILRQGFAIEKYGSEPQIKVPASKPVEAPPAPVPVVELVVEAPPVIPEPLPEPIIEQTKKDLYGEN